MPKQKRAKGHRKVKKAEVRRGKARPNPKKDSILALRGLGKHIWADVDADAYVARLREGWD
jgi:hypothetical protein